MELVLGGMTCGACANRIERKLNKVAGVQATVNYATEKASVTHPTAMSADELISVVEAAGYTAALPPDPGDGPDDDAPDPALREHRTRLLVCAVLAAPVVAMAMIPVLQLPYWQWVSLALALPVAVWGARGRSTGPPVATCATARRRWTRWSRSGSLAAYGWSLYALLFGDAGGIGCG